MDTSDQTSAFRFDDTILHLSIDATTVVRQFSWDQIEKVDEEIASPDDGGRIVCTFPQAETWTTWERHPAGEELVMLLSGRVDLLQEIDGETRRTELHPGMAVVNPPGVWHTADVHEPGVGLFITPGRGTEHRPR
jgi:quercetin dioxygenase-like cupin family protein